MLLVRTRASGSKPHFQASSPPGTPEPGVNTLGRFETFTSFFRMNALKSCSLYDLPSAALMALDIQWKELMADV